MASPDVETSPRLNLVPLPNLGSSGKKVVTFKDSPATSKEVGVSSGPSTRSSRSKTRESLSLEGGRSLGGSIRGSIAGSGTSASESFFNCRRQSRKWNKQHWKYGNTLTAGSSSIGGNQRSLSGDEDNCSAGMNGTNGSLSSASGGPTNGSCVISNHDNSRRRNMRKRSYSFTEGHCRSVSSVQPCKRWKNNFKNKLLSEINGKKDDSKSGGVGGLGTKLGGSSKNVLPSKFLLGGNIRDPLNLNSLSDERISKIVNATTPECSPVPTPKHRKAEYKIEVLIPPNISDPLNLNAGVDETEYESQLISPGAALHFKRKRFRNRKRLKNSSLSTASLPHPDSDTDDENEKSDEKKTSDETTEVLKKTEEDTNKTEIKHHKHHGPTSSINKPFNLNLKEINKKLDDIVSPVVPQPGQKHKPNVHSKNTNRKNQQSNGKPSFHLKNKKFEYGNYNRYYGYRNVGNEQDIRLGYMKPEWFSGKNVLDIGCNIGNITISVAQNFHPKSIIGIDIDQNLIGVARKNVRKILSATSSSGTNYPKSLSIIFGSLNNELNPDFSDNIKFVCSNYVLESDELLDSIVPEFDVIMCLSTTKWIHLNFGDEGLKRTFKRIFAQLRPGGKFILEAQSFASYRKKNKLTPRIYKNFQNIKLRPENFGDYLLHEIGFNTSETIAVPQHHSKGFQRPLQIFTKLAPTSSRTASSAYNTPFEENDEYQQKKRCYAPAMTPLYGKVTPKTPKRDDDVNVDNKSSKSSKTDFNYTSPKPGPSGLGKKKKKKNQEKFPAPPPTSSPYYSIGGGPTPPGRTPTIGMTPQYDLGTPSYNPDELDIAPGTYYGYNTPAQSGITPGYSGPSPDGYSNSKTPLHHGGYSPVYSGPPPGTFSGASTPGNEESARYTPHYTPSYDGGVTSPAYSPGNATPLHGGSTPGTPPNHNPYYGPNSSAASGNNSNTPSQRQNRSSSTTTSPQIQQPEITGNTTPHPGTSSSPATNEPRYLWYGYSSSGGNTPQNEEPSSSPKVYPTQYAFNATPPPNIEGEISNPATPASPLTPLSPTTPNSPIATTPNSPATSTSPAPMDERPPSTSPRQ